MAAFGLLLLLSAAAAASGQVEQVLQESLDLQPINIGQVLQQEVDPVLPPDILLGRATTVSSRPPTWGSALDGFPPAWPVAAAVTRHCRDPPTVPPPPMLPPNAFAHLHRQAAALAALRPRMSDCCRQRTPLPCARRAWTDVLDGFCTDEFAVKTRQFHCCRRHGAARRRCFAQETPAPTWHPNTSWEPNTAWDLLTEPPFPPGEPTAANLGNICGLRELRPGPPAPDAPSGPRIELRVRLEREYGRCCRNESLSCAHSAWLKGMNRFCREESAVKTRQHWCCQRRGLRARGRCFAAAAPVPAYDRELHNVSLVRPGPGLLRSLCGPTRLFTQRRPVPELFGAMTAACCPLAPEERGVCAREQLSQAIATLCATPEDAWRDPQGCCSWEEPERRRCFDNAYLDQVTLGAAVAPPPPGQDE
ncbi:extracellular matrix protein 1 [Pipra filicauda]|uniref:Extracellular matrix protein 1 n=1 Tax=Pipra filicauda TaxID=649802 RepID=A0A7R5KQU4_9PASS|nr:extracellular matrix protein 1 [Pipra filicauda]